MNITMSRTDRALLCLSCQSWTALPSPPVGKGSLKGSSPMGTMPTPGPPIIAGGGRRGGRGVGGGGGGLGSPLAAFFFPLSLCSPCVELLCNGGGGRAGGRL